jgi:hypothetical protein
MFLPQRGVLAPTLSLAGQLLYPSGALNQSASLAVSPGHLRWLLQVVGLSDLWERANGDWEGEHSWLQVSPIHCIHRMLFSIFAIISRVEGVGVERSLEKVVSLKI